MGFDSTLVILIGIPAAVRDAVHLFLWWRFAFFSPCFLYIKGCEENSLASCSSVVFGIYICNPSPWEFSCGQLSLTETPGLVN